MKNNNLKRITLIIMVLALFCGMVWYFTSIFVYIFIALILAIMGSPLMRLLEKVRIGKRPMPKSAAAGITLIVIMAVLAVIISLLIPLVSHEVRQLQNFDYEAFFGNFEKISRQATQWLKSNHIVSRDFDLAKLITNHVTSMVPSLNVTSIFGDVISMAGSVFICLFSVLFMTFFALKDNTIFWKMLKKLIPASLRGNFDNILSETKMQLRKYFFGVFIEMLIVGTLDCIICLILGVPYALLIGVIGGLLNIIPYVGPLIAGCLSVGIGIYATLTAGSSDILPIIIKIVSTFIAVKMIDDFILQPNIYGKSVNAHPLEIFIVILVAGKVGGVWGMLFGVPAYTLIRIIVGEFFWQYFIPVQDLNKRNQPKPEQQQANFKNHNSIDEKQID